MNLSRIEKAPDHEVEKWLIKELQLSDYQKSILRGNEIVRFSEYSFYRFKKKEKANFLWRLTLIFFPFVYLLMLAYNPVRWVFTGKWGYHPDIYNGWYGKWVRKLDINF